MLADRGQGVRATIKRVRPDVANDREALRVAFTEVISGRFPEQRGNGLKFVKKIIQENNWGLRFYSGTAEARVSSNNLEILDSSIIVPGTYSIISY